MEAPHAMLFQLIAHINGELNTVFFDRGIIFMNGRKRVVDKLRDFGFAQGSHALEAAVRLNGHDSRDDGACNS